MRKPRYQIEVALTPEVLLRFLQEMPDWARENLFRGYEKQGLWPDGGQDLPGDVWVSRAYIREGNGDLVLVLETAETERFPAVVQGGRPLSVFISDPVKTR